MLVSLSACSSCLKRVPEESVSELEYPNCGAGSLPPGEVLWKGHLRSGPTMRDKRVVEFFEFRRRDCLYVVTVRQEWPLGVADVEVVYDDRFRPLRAWKRMTLPTENRPTKRQMSRNQATTVDIRRYELRTDPPTMTRRSSKGLEHFRFRAPRPVAVIGPGRGLVGAWIRAQALSGSPLEPGQTTRGPVLDFRRMVERVETVALRRDADRTQSDLGNVRVYTVFGRESVFADDQGNIVGDLAGLRPHRLLKSPAPPRFPMRTRPDPVHTP